MAGGGAAVPAAAAMFHCYMGQITCHRPAVIILDCFLVNDPLTTFNLCWSSVKTMFFSGYKELHYGWVIDATGSKANLPLVRCCSVPVCGGFAGIPTTRA